MKNLRLIALAILTALTPGAVLAQAVVAPGFEVDSLAVLSKPAGLALAPAGSAFYPGLYVSSFGISASDPDSVFLVSDSGAVSFFAELVPEADPTNMEFPIPGGPFGDHLYITANNRDFGQPLDCGGVIQRVDSAGVVFDHTLVAGCAACLGGGSGLGEPAAIAFGPGGAYGTDLFVANSSDVPADICRVTPPGGIVPFLDDGVCSNSATGGFAPTDVAFGPGGAWGTDLYFSDFGDMCYCVRTVSSTGAASAALHTFPVSIHRIEFGTGGAFGTDLYAATSDTLYRVTPAGSISVFLSGEGLGALRLEFAPGGEALYVTVPSVDLVLRVRPSTSGLPPNLPAGRVVLHPGSPNPFVRSTTIRYEVPFGSGEMAIRVYDPAGRLVRTLMEGSRAASGAVRWNGRRDNGRALPPGVYLYRLEGRGIDKTGKIILMR